ncbi:MAG: hypothetical protein KF778_03020 [Rhodocyclaceae bacterium]|nr:hypothetical protein [Rhodocyclaceae bacterium]MBX3667349.1 hypothetical protein [Rhodocyclaceae bacterium]
MKAISLLVGLSLCATTAWAKLPDPSPKAKAKADMTKAENAHKDKVAGYKLCMSQNAVAARYFKSSGKSPKSELPACADPGKFDPATVAAAAPAAPAAAAAAAAAAPAAAPAPAEKK